MTCARSGNGACAGIVYDRGARALLFLILGALAYQTGAAPQEDWVRRAEKLQRDKPTAGRALGLLELRRTANEKLELPRTAADLPKPSGGRDAIVAEMIFRNLPATDRPALETALTLWAKTGSKDPWLGVLRLYAAGLANDRPALIAAANALAEGPTSFPSVAAEQAHFELLRELGVDENRAGLEVLSGRSYAPLHALLDLDRALTRDVDTLAGTSRAADGKVLQAARDRLRQAYLDASRHTVERLFALNLLGRTQEVEAVLFAARELPYLTDPAELSRVLARLDQSQAWSLLIAPLLESEIRVIANPPKLPRSTGPAPAAELVIEAKSRSLQSGVSTYDGGVRARAGALDIACDKLALLGESPASPRILSGAGHVTIKGAPGHDLIRADLFTYQLDTGAYALSGNVRLTRGERTTKFRAAILTRTGAVQDPVSLLDDFDNADAAGRLGLLRALTTAYADDELSPGARYLLALSLLRGHLSWQPAETAWPAEVPLEDFQKEDARVQLKSEPAAAGVASLLERDFPAKLSCRVAGASDADVVRAAKLLETLGDTELGGRARYWRGVIFSAPAR